MRRHMAIASANSAHFVLTQSHGFVLPGVVSYHTHISLPRWVSNTFIECTHLWMLIALGTFIHLSWNRAVGILRLIPRQLRVCTHTYGSRSTRCSSAVSLSARRCLCVCLDTLQFWDTKPTCPPPSTRGAVHQPPDSPREASPTRVFRVQKSHGDVPQGFRVLHHPPACM